MCEAETVNLNAVGRSGVDWSQQKCPLLVEVTGNTQFRPRVSDIQELLVLKYYLDICEKHLKLWMLATKSYKKYCELKKK